MFTHLVFLQWPQNGGSANSICISDTLVADVIATKNAVFIECCDIEQVAIGSKGRLTRCIKTKFRLQDRTRSLIGEYTQSFKKILYH